MIGLHGEPGAVINNPAFILNRYLDFLYEVGLEIPSPPITDPVYRFSDSYVFFPPREKAPLASLVRSVT